MTIRKTDVFMKWLKNLKDSNARFRIYRRIERLAGGNPGDVKPAGKVFLKCVLIMVPVTGCITKIPERKLLFCSAAEIKQHKAGT
jgi:hypothetical protein